MSSSSLTTESKERLARLGLVISHIEDPFFCQGKVRPKECITLKLLPKTATAAASAPALSSAFYLSAAAAVAALVYSVLVSCPNASGESSASSSSSGLATPVAATVMASSAAFSFYARARGATAAAEDAAVKLVLPEPFFPHLPEAKGKELLERYFIESEFLEKVLEAFKATPLKEDFSKLLDDVFEPSPFGHGGETVLDHSVRKALQVKADRIVSTGMDLGQLGILKAVRAGLAPQAKRIHASLDKLNIYARGGHFKSHRDTPRDKLAFGTLVVALPSNFVGGKLVVRHRDSTHTCDWGDKTGQRGDLMGLDRLSKTPENVLQWCAFFGHCDHKIEQVVEGHRVTLTYILRYDPSDKGIADQMQGASALPCLPAEESESEEGKSEEDGEEEGKEEKEQEESEECDNDEMTGEQMRFMLSFIPIEQLQILCRAGGLDVLTFMSLPYSNDVLLLIDRVFVNHPMDQWFSWDSGSEEELISQIILKAGLDPNQDTSSEGREERRHSASSTPMREQPTMPDRGTYPAALAASLGIGLYRELVAALRDDSFLEEGGLVGVPCMHLYCQDAELPPLRKEVLDGKFDAEKFIHAAGNPPEKGGKGKGKARVGEEEGKSKKRGRASAKRSSKAVRAGDLHLKGADGLVYTCAARLGLRPMVLRVVWGENFANGDKYSLKKLPSLQTAYDWCSVDVVEDSFVARVLSPEDSIEPEAIGPCQGSNFMGEMDLDTEDVAWVVTPPFACSVGSPADSVAPAANILDNIFVSHTGYFGNEASTTTYYASAAIVFVVPPTGSKGRAVFAAKASNDRAGKSGDNSSSAPAEETKAGETKAGETKAEETQAEETKAEETKAEETKASADTPSAKRADDREAVFGGLRRGLHPSKEEAAWSKYARAWKKGKPDLPREDVVALAQDHGVPSGGSKEAIMKRIGLKAEHERFLDQQEFAFGF